MDDQPPPLGLGLGKENEAGGREGLKRQPPQPSSLSHNTARKRLKEGEMLTITYEGSAYLIEIVSIQRNNFRIRLNSEELVRPIK